MKYVNQSFILFILIFSLTSGLSYAESATSDVEDASFDKNNFSLKATTRERFFIPRNHKGIREVDWTNKQHEEFIHDRLKAAGISEAKFPQLYQNQQKLKKIQTQKQPAHGVKKEETSSGAIETVDLRAHYFTSLRRRISNEDSQLYLELEVKSSVAGGTLMSYMDLKLEDADGNQIVPVAKTFDFIQGKDTKVTAKVSLKALQEQFPNLDLIYASSYLETELEDGTIRGTIKHVQYPFSWKDIERRTEQRTSSDSSYSESQVNASSVEDSRVEDIPEDEYYYSFSAPVNMPANNDIELRICSGRANWYCDYHSGQQDLPVEQLGVYVPFRGTIRLPHRITRIYPTGQYPNGVDETTSIYMQRGRDGGVTMQSYTPLNSPVRHFSDYLSLHVAESRRTTTIQWDIPFEEGYFGPATGFSNRAISHWYYNIVVDMVPNFGSGPATQTKITIGSRHPNAQVRDHIPGRDPIAFMYFCLAKGTQVTLADGTYKSIEEIKEGDLVLGADIALTSSPKPMKVVEVSDGVDGSEIYRVRFRNSEDLLITGSHPVSTVKKGVVWADELSVGDQMNTQSGSQLVIGVEKESYQDNTYNLRLAPIDDGAETREHYWGYYANGLLVGDMRSQEIFLYQDQLATPEEVMKRLPERWQVDYLNSLQLDQ